MGETSVNLCLDDFDRTIRIDGPSLRAEIQAARSACGAGRGKLISDDVWSGWRKLSGAPKGKQYYTQRQAAIVAWIALYSISGKFANENLPFSKIEKSHYPRIANEWIKALSNQREPHVARVVRWVLSISLTPESLQSAINETGKGKISQRTLERWARIHREPIAKNRPLRQSFVRKIIQKTVLKPVPSIP